MNNFRHVSNNIAKFPKTPVDCCVRLSTKNIKKTDMEISQ